ncbi:hypothetical protein BJY01DRAFT_250655 [Aspergillus pseudoustus]|uniref:BTB domain-containing protein n=1 Tax=Aspergillus pseudoustus TaxID=1810923 RepID=A0ABR4JHR4_9EURO
MNSPTDHAAPHIQKALSLVDDATTLKEHIRKALKYRYGGLFMIEAVHKAELRECRHFYETAVPLMFNNISEYRHILMMNLTAAVEWKSPGYAEAIIARARRLPEDRHRVYILGQALTIAALNSDSELTAMILKNGKFPLYTLADPFKWVCGEGNMDFVKLLVPHIVQPLVVDATIFEEDYQRNEDEIADCLALHRDTIIASGLELAAFRNSHSICAVILEAYLEILNPSSAADNRRVQPVCPELAPALYRQLSRAQCFEFLSHPIPSMLRHELLKHLHESAPLDMLVTAEGYTYRAHKDILAQFSSYFRALAESTWLDSIHVDFGDNMSMRTLHAFLFYVRHGVHDYVVLSRHNIQLEDLLVAADYLGVECLVSHLRRTLDSSHDEEDPVFYSANDGGN